MLKTHLRLLYGNIELIPAERPEWLPSVKDVWALPGRTTATTKELLKRADKRGIVVNLIEHCGAQRTIRKLN